MVAGNLAPKRRLQADYKAEPLFLKTRPQKGDGRIYIFPHFTLPQVSPVAIHIFRLKFRGAKL
ncbi:MAG: hypothetical protein B6247_30790 [Candidatus Parabeggiatoa sp. nov. 2]|nr:MAG: hypothetical protein B6247_30790 [Beggiatoa sp. 4572_84]